MPDPKPNQTQPEEITHQSIPIYLDLTRILLKIIQEKTDLKQYQPGSPQLDTWEIRQLAQFHSYHYLIPILPQENILVPIQTKPTAAFFTYEKNSFINVYPNYVVLQNGLIMSESLAQMSGFKYAPFQVTKNLYIRYKTP